MSRLLPHRTSLTPTWSPISKKSWTGTTSSSAEGSCKMTDDFPSGAEDLQRDASVPSAAEQFEGSPWTGYEPPTPPPYEPDAEVVSRVLANEDPPRSGGAERSTEGEHHK